MANTVSLDERDGGASKKYAALSLPLLGTIAGNRQIRRLMGAARAGKWSPPGGYPAPDLDLADRMLRGWGGKWSGLSRDQKLAIRAETGLQMRRGGGGAWEYLPAFSPRLSRETTSALDDYMFTARLPPDGVVPYRRVMDMGRTPEYDLATPGFGDLPVRFDKFYQGLGALSIAGRPKILVGPRWLRWGNERLFSGSRKVLLHEGTGHYSQYLAGQPYGGSSNLPDAASGRWHRTGSRFGLYPGDLAREHAAAYLASKFGPSWYERLAPGPAADPAYGALPVDRRLALARESAVDMYSGVHPLWDLASSINRSLSPGVPVSKLAFATPGAVLDAFGVSDGAGLPEYVKRGLAVRSSVQAAMALHPGVVGPAVGDFHWNVREGLAPLAGLYRSVRDAYDADMAGYRSFVERERAQNPWLRAIDRYRMENFRRVDFGAERPKGSPSRSGYPETAGEVGARVEEYIMDVPPEERAATLLDDFVDIPTVDRWKSEHPNPGPGEHVPGEIWDPRLQKAIVNGLLNGVDFTREDAKGGETADDVDDFISELGPDDGLESFLSELDRKGEREWRL